eukprot:COSAG01_NODE_10258_length_2208_cov_1.998578_3_plen_111_part_00
MRSTQHAAAVSARRRTMKAAERLNCMLLRCHLLGIWHFSSGMYSRWHDVYTWAQKKCEVMLMFVSRGWYHSKWCTKEWFQDFKGMGADMPKLFIVLLDALPVTGYRIDTV